MENESHKNNHFIDKGNFNIKEFIKILNFNFAIFKNNIKL